MTCEKSNEILGFRFVNRPVPDSANMNTGSRRAITLRWVILFVAMALSKTNASWLIFDNLFENMHVPLTCDITSNQFTSLALCKGHCMWQNFRSTRMGCRRSATSCFVCIPIRIHDDETLFSEEDPI